MIQINAIRIALRQIDGEPVTVAMLFEFEGKKMLTVWLASLVTGLLVLVGMILLIIPGIYLALAYSQVINLIADKGVGVREAMRLSKEMMRGIKLKYMGFGFVLALLNFGGLLALGVGLIVTMMITGFAQIVLYKSLLGKLEPVGAGGASETGPVVGGGVVGEGHSPAVNPPIGVNAPVTTPASEVQAVTGPQAPATMGGGGGGEQG